MGQTFLWFALPLALSALLHGVLLRYGQNVYRAREVVSDAHSG